jgi:hypothetical protein
MFATNSFYGGSVASSQVFNPMADYSDQHILDTRTYATDHQRCCRDDNQMQNWTSPINTTHVSPHSAETEFVDWNLTTDISSAMQATNIHRTNKQPSNHPPSYQFSRLEPDGTQRSVFESPDENTIAIDISQSHLASTGTDSDDRYSQVPAPAQDTTIKTNLIRCWLHGCNGRSFTHRSNYRRHCREKSKQQVGFSCLLCSKRFTRKASWKTHFDQQRCKFIDYDANGIPSERKRHSSIAMYAIGSSQTPPH